MTLRITAAVAVVLIAIALVATYVASHRSPSGGVPAGGQSLSIAKYQALMKADRDAMQQVSFNCDSLTSLECPQSIATTISTSLRWDADLAAFNTPAPFVVIDAQLRQHLAINRQELTAALGARNAGDATLFVNALNYAGAAGYWVGVVSEGIISSHSVTASQYTTHAAGWKRVLAGCTECNELARLSDFTCATVNESSCETNLFKTDESIVWVVTGVVTYSAPSSLIEEDTRLRSDLANADKALLDMEAALVARDEAGLAAGRVAFRAALAATEADLTAIAGA